MRLEDKRKDKAALTVQAPHSAIHARCGCGAGHPLTPTALATAVICTAISQDPLNLHEKIHNYVILYLQIPYQPLFLNSRILKQRKTRIALKKLLVSINTCSLLSSLPEQELSSQLPRVTTSSAAPWLCLQPT